MLLTHATTAHIAAFAHCCKHIPLFSQIPIYATNPVISLGRTLLQDIYSSTPLASTVIPETSLIEASYTYSTSGIGNSLQLLLQPPTLDEIASYFSLINPLKYSQPHQPLPSSWSPPLNGLTITAYNAGHTLGGTVWHIQSGMESVVYAVDWNQVRENVLSGAAWLGGSGAGGAEVIEQLRKPTALICSTKGSEKNPLAGGRSKRDDLLLEMIRTSISKGGTVLIPTDTSARVLELAYLLDHAWRREATNQGSPFHGAILYLASRNVGATMRYAGSMLEWMDENVVKEFEASATNPSNRQHNRTDSKQMRNNQDALNNGSKPSESAGGPFDFTNLRLVERKSQVDKILANKAAKVILASDASMEWGFSKEILRHIASGPANLIILTQDYGVESGTDVQDLGRTLWGWYQERRDGVAMEIGSDGQRLEQVHTGGRDLRVVDARSSALEGKELLIYQQYLATQRQFQPTLQANGGTSLDTSNDAIDETSSTSSSSSDQSDPERQGKALNISTTLAHGNRNKLNAAKQAVGVNMLLYQKNMYDYDVRDKKGREAMFPFTTKRRRGDDFGEVIRPEEYLRAEERDEVDGQDMRGAGTGKEPRMGQKRKWEDPGQPNGNSRRSSIGAAKRQRIGGVSRENRPFSGTSHEKDNNLNGHMLDEVSEDSESEVEEPPMGPSKLTFETATAQVNLRIAYVDFAGIHDQRSLSMLIPLIQPRKVIFVGGTASETLWLADYYRKKLRSRSVQSDGEATDDIFCPMVGETVSASMDTNAWTVKLSEALVRRLHWQNVGGLGVVTLMGQLAATVAPENLLLEASKPKRQKLLKGEVETPATEDLLVASEPAPALPPTLDMLPASMIAATRSVAQPLHVGDLRLADLRKLLQSAGHMAEFRGEGTLLIDDLIAVRKSGTGRIEVESGGFQIPVSMMRDHEDSFQAVKRKIYDGLAVIAGG